MGGVVLGEAPNGFAERRYPFRERWLRAYEPSFTNSAKYNYNLERKRKIEELRRDRMSSRRPTNVQDNSVPHYLNENWAAAPPPSRDNKRASAPGFYHSPKVDEKKQSNVAAKDAGRTSGKPGVISVPATAIVDDSGKANRTGISAERMKKSENNVPMERAAVIVQSCFRGYMVRRRETLKQLRTIAKVKAQWNSLLEQTSSSEFLDSITGNVTARMALMETIMHMLLQLDSIQGAHPVVRDIRKAATRDVIDLQEKVDACLTKNPCPDICTCHSSDNVGLEVLREKPVVDSPSLKQHVSLAVDEAAVLGGLWDGVPGSKEESIVVTFDSLTNLTESYPANAGASALDYVISSKDKSISDLQIANALDSLSGPDNDPENAVAVAERTVTNVQEEAVVHPRLENKTTLVQNCGNGESKHFMDSRWDNYEQGRGNLNSLPSSTDSVKKAVDEVYQQLPSCTEIANEFDVEEQSEDGVACNAAGQTMVVHLSSLSQVDINLPPKAVLPESPRSPLDVVDCVSDSEVNSKRASERNQQEGAVGAHSETTTSSSQYNQEGEAFGWHIKATTCQKTRPDVNEEHNMQPVREEGAVGAHSETTANSPQSEQEDEALGWHSKATSCQKIRPDVYEERIMQPARETVGNRPLLVKLRNENKAMKALLLTVLKWNDQQATSIYELNSRLEKVERTLSHTFLRRSQTSKGLHRKANESRRRSL